MVPQTSLFSQGLIIGNLLHPKNGHNHGPDLHYLPLVVLNKNIFGRCPKEIFPNSVIFDDELVI